MRSLQLREWRDSPLSNSAVSYEPIAGLLSPWRAGLFPLFGSRFLRTFAQDQRHLPFARWLQLQEVVVATAVQFGQVEVTQRGIWVRVVVGFAFECPAARDCSPGRQCMG